MMFRSRSVVAAAVLIALSCGPGASRTSTPQKPHHSRAAVIDPQVCNLLRGVVMTERSGEQELAASALMAMDGDLKTSWMTPVGDPRQHCTLSLPARTRIESVGIANRFVSGPARAAGSVQWEWSADGTSFAPLHTITTTQIGNDQQFPVQPVDALFLRATILGTLDDANTAELPELMVRGDELEAPRRGALAGSWKLNQLDARLAEDGSRFYGVVQQEPPTLIEGAWSGRYGRFAWIRGKQFGVGFLTLDRSGRHLNALWWFEEAITPYFAMPWFGRKTGSALPASTEFEDLSLQNRKEMPFYQIVFDEANRLVAESRPALDRVREILDRHPGMRFRMVAHEVRGASAEADQKATDAQIAALGQAFAEQRIDTSRISFLSAGRSQSRDPGEPPIYYALLHSRVELEVIEE